jgi:hypothetical protein
MPCRALTALTSRYSTVLLAILLVPIVMQAQTRRRPVDPAPSKPLVAPLFRSERPFSVLFDFSGGIGAEYTLTDHMGVSAMTTLTGFDVRADYFLLGSNISPFVAVGMGARKSGPGDDISGSWKEAQGGFEYAEGQGFFRIELRYIVDQSDGLNLPRFNPGFAFGFRM